QFNTSGAITLNGTLNIFTVSSFRPATNDLFTIMGFGSRVGNFTTITGLDQGSGCSFQPTFNANSLVLQAVSTGPVVVTIDPITPTLNTGAMQQCPATVTGDCNVAKTWSVEEGPAGGSITSTGLYAAPSSGGVFHVRSTSVGDPTVFARATVTVTQPATDVVVA